MSAAGRAVPVISGILAIVGGAAGAWWFATAKPLPPNSGHAASPTTVKKVGEGELGTITLTEEAEQRLGVQALPVERKSIERVRIYGGEVMVPAGKSILVAAPMQGTLLAPGEGVPQAGQRVTKGQHVISLLPLLSPEARTTLAASRADAEGQVNNAQTQMNAMKLALERAQRLYREEAGSKRAVEEAQAQHDVALKSLAAAESRLDILSQAVGSAAAGRTEPIQLEAPVGGILRNVSALSGQNVPSGAPLFEISDLSEMWVRVPVHVGDLRDIAPNKNAQVGNLNLQAVDPTWSATPVAAPPSANPAAATVDLFFALENERAQLTPGQRVGVQLPLVTHGESLTVPWSAVIHDYHGGTWVYEVLGPRTYRRERVQVRYVIDGTAALAAGPAAGTKVVAEGAIELFGAETGFSK